MEYIVHLSPTLEDRFGKLIETYRMRYSGGLPAYLSVNYQVLQQKPPIWIHAASGEYEYAKPIIRELAGRGEVIFVTYFSPTYRKNIESDQNVKGSCPLPLDNAIEIRDLIAHLKPKCLLIARTDTWPNLLIECADAKVPTLLFSATFHALSGRVGSAGGRLTRAIYPLLSEAHGVTQDDCNLLKKFGVTKTLCAGDTRYDQVLKRLDEKRPLIPGIRSILRREILVAGSVWQEDLNQILPGLLKEIENDQAFSVILVPHETSSREISRISSDLRKRGVRFATYSQLERGDAISKVGLQVLVVDRVGILAELYQMGALAFVGGSFKKTVHSVMEPLAAGCVCLVGPLHLNNREALDFQSDQLFQETGLPPWQFDFSPVISVQSANDFAEKLSQVRTALHTNRDSTSTQTQDQIKELVRRRGGATQKALDWIESL
jgi:3-deoxy-D-manno-octulosonic-acid transferase